MKSPIFVALDVDTSSLAYAIAEKVEPYVGGFKLGPRLLYTYGASLVSKLAKLAPVFVDNKYYDIPNTMEASVRASFEGGASYVTIHASCGRDALVKMAQLEKELSAQRPFRVLAVTVLTSFSENHLPVNWNSQWDLEEHVLRLADEVYQSGLHSFVASAHEAPVLRKTFPDCFIVTPGIRLPEDSLGDQKRIMTPGEALQRGASMLVVGRPICNSANPAVAAQKFLNMCSGELKRQE